MPGRSLVLTIAQLNPVVGDLPGNLEKIADAYRDAERNGSALVVTPAYSLTGAPLDDLTDSRDFLDAVNDAFAAAAKLTENRAPALAVGLPYRKASGAPGHAAVILAGGKILDVVGVEHPCRTVRISGVRVGFHTGGGVWPREMEADIVVRAAAAVFTPDSLRHRVEAVALPTVRATGVPFVSVNLAGGQDEVVFEGGSFCLDGQGRTALRLPLWEECARTFSVAEEAGDGAEGSGFPFPDARESVYMAMTVGLRDYVRKNGFTDVVLGLSGGMDSALVAAVAGDALGAERVHCIRLPSAHTSALSNTAAEEMCRIWGFSLDTLPIGELVAAAEKTVSPAIRARGAEELKKLSRENVQARARGFLLMTLSNDCGWLLLSTGNKSEIAVGYSTLYGDMAGAYNPLKDVFKTMSYAVADWRNRNRPAGLSGPAGEVIPQSIIDRPPSAELSDGQLDTDSLPPYATLDAVLRELVEKETSATELAARGDFDPALVRRVHRMLRLSEYKRRQAAPGPKTTDRAFTLDRRMPMTNAFDPFFLKENLLPDAET